MGIRISEAALREVEEAFAHYIDEVNSSDLSLDSRHLYVYQAQLFLRWMRYDFTPGEGLSDKATARMKAEAEAEAQAQAQAKAEMDVEAKVWARFWDEGWGEDEADTLEVGDTRIVEAINQHRLILIEYFPGVRLIEPYGYGLHKNGN